MKFMQGYRINDMRYNDNVGSFVYRHVDARHEGKFAIVF